MAYPNKALTASTPPGSPPISSVTWWRWWNTKPHLDWALALETSGRRGDAVLSRVSRVRAQAGPTEALR